MKLFYILNDFFLADNDEEVAISDYIWIGGFFMVISIITIVILLSVNIS